MASENADRVQQKYRTTLSQIGKPLEEPLIGSHLQLPVRPRPAEHPVFDMTLLYIPIYCHLVLHPPGEIQRPPTPELITRARIEKAVENWMD
ncbi:WD repeat-containing protein on Y chromosome [Anopheles aquasalis]|uniref:WD repeat-containing protein on Y chromosome n=1 Tax=Anopheles aquasalis TaxID=42839 RepID=UPI00215A376A|nr:WD repeat-containing protein on Y chromosome [Anopheles aquasalis]